MKKLLIIPFLLISFIGSATNYYVKVGGNDSYTGLSDDQAWATTTKVNTVWAAGTFAPNDQILFNKGDTFYGSLTCTEGGTSGNPITIGAYGTGAKPVITGLSTVTGWTQESGTIYKKVIATQSALHMLLIDGVPYNIGRYPKGLVYNTIDAFSNYEIIEDGETVKIYTSITDAALPDESVYNFTGADLIKVCNAYRITSDTITNHTNTTLTHTNSRDESVVGWGYFIQNSLLCLQMPDATFGEWYYNTATSTLYVNFDQNPEGVYNVQIATIDDLVKFTANSDYITFDGLSFYGNNHAGFMLTQNNYINIQNCDIYYSGCHGINFQTPSLHVTISNNDINHANNLAIKSYYGASHYMTVTNNRINNIGMFIACGKRRNDAVDKGDSWLGGSAICGNRDNYSVFEYNKITNCGFNGIVAGGINTIIRYNFMDNLCIYQDDGGGIYTGGEFTGMKIYGNIIINTVGTLTGHGNSTTEGVGIYLDEISTTNYIEVYENVIYSASFGIYLHHGRYHRVHDNLVYHCKYHCLRVASIDGTTMGIDLNIQNNIFIAKTATSYASYWGVTNSAYYQTIGTVDYNIYARPIDDDYTFNTRIGTGSEVQYDLAGWRTLSGEDAHSTASLADPVTSEDDIHFIYNDTTVIKSFTLSAAMKDVANASYSGTIELLPYTGLVLLGEGIVIEGGSIPAPSGVRFKKSVRGKLLISKNNNLSK